MLQSLVPKNFLSGDRNLWLRLKKYKDQAAFLSAYDNYAKDLYRFIYYKIGDLEEAKDLTSQVFVKCWTYVQDGKLREAEEYKTLRSFLYKVARNTVIDYYRQQKPEMNLEGLEIKDSATAEGSPIRLERQADWLLIEDRLKQLKAEYRGLIVMRYVNQLSIAEIALVLDKSKAATRVAIFRALQALKNLINQ